MKSARVNIINRLAELPREIFAFIVRIINNQGRLYWRCPGVSTLVFQRRAVLDFAKRYRGTFAKLISPYGLHPPVMHTWGDY